MLVSLRTPEVSKDQIAIIDCDSGEFLAKWDGSALSDLLDADHALPTNIALAPVSGNCSSHCFRVPSVATDTSLVAITNELKDDLKPITMFMTCLLYTSPSPRDQRGSRMPSSA